MKKYLENKTKIILSDVIDNVISIYPGRFQPYGRHHNSVYEWQCELFGYNNTYITTSNKVDERSPFTFEEKKRIMVEGYDLNSDKIVQCKSPYSSREITDNYDIKRTACVYALGVKDYNEVKCSYTKTNGSPSYLQRFTTIEDLKPISEHSYIILAPHYSIQIEGIGEMSGTALRLALGSGNEQIFEELMGWYNEDIAKMMYLKLRPYYINKIDEFIENGKALQLIKESNTTGGRWAAQDDGPRFLVGNMATFKNISGQTAMKLGFTVIDYILGNHTNFEIHDTEPPKGPTKAVSYFKVGVQKKPGEASGGTDYVGDIDSSLAFIKWSSEIQALAKRMGMELISYLDAQKSIEDADTATFSK